MCGIARISWAEVSGAAFAKLLAAVDGDGVLTFDINPNSLREAFRLLVGQGLWQFMDRSRLGLGRSS